MAAMEQVTAPTMTRMVASLERDGLVRRRTDTGDKRVVWVTATSRGRKLIEQGRKARVRFLEDHVAALTAAERRILARASEIMHRIYFDSRED